MIRYNHTGNWRATLVSGRDYYADVNVVNGQFSTGGHLYTLRNTDPVSFVWADGTVQTLEKFEDRTITWKTTNSGYPTIFWDLVDMKDTNVTIGSFLKSCNSVLRRKN